MNSYERRPGESYEQYMARMDETRARILRKMRIGWIVLYVSLGVMAAGLLGEAAAQVAHALGVLR